MTAKCKYTSAWLSCLSCRNSIVVNSRTCEDDIQVRIGNVSAVVSDRPQRQIETGGICPKSDFAQLTIFCSTSCESCRTSLHLITAKVRLQTDCFENVVTMSVNQFRLSIVQVQPDGKLPRFDLAASCQWLVCLRYCLQL